MTARRKKPGKKRAAKLSVGDRVRFVWGIRWVTGVVVEDRGPLGIGGRQIVTVRFKKDGENDSLIELPAEELRAA